MIQAQPVVPMGMTSRVIVLCVASWTGHMLPAMEGVIIDKVSNSTVRSCG